MSAVTPATYHAVLVGHHEGAKVMDDLIARFDARLSFMPGQADVTAYREGQRSVVRWLLETLVSVESGAPKFPPTN